MPLPAHQRAPETLELIKRLNDKLISRGLTREEFREKLNELLPPARRLKSTHSGLVQITRWLDPTSIHWSEPMGEVVLAMKNFVENH